MLLFLSPTVSINDADEPSPGPVFALITPTQILDCKVSEDGDGVLDSSGDTFVKFENSVVPVFEFEDIVDVLEEEEDIVDEIEGFLSKLLSG